MERVRAPDSRDRLPMFIPNPLNVIVVSPSMCLFWTESEGSLSQF
jgi:hypothetical protein